MVLEHFRDQCIAGRHIGDIAAVDPCLAVRGLDLLLGIDELLLAPGDEHDLSARSGELARSRLADPGGCAGDDDHLFPDAARAAAAEEQIGVEMTLPVVPSIR